MSKVKLPGMAVMKHVAAL